MIALKIAALDALIAHASVAPALLLAPVLGRWSAVLSPALAGYARPPADAGAKLILVGDDRQLSSFDRGGLFSVLKDRHGAAQLSEVRRQHKIDERRASEMLAEGNFDGALGIYEQKGAINWTLTQKEARAELVQK